MNLRNLFKQAVKFVGLSGMGWILDFCMYTGLGFVSGNLMTNNIISSWVGVTFVFIFASGKIFRNDNQISLKWKYVIYLLYQCILIYFVSKLLVKINIVITRTMTDGLILQFSTVISKLLVTPVTMVLNFFVMKWVIEKL